MRVYDPRGHLVRALVDRSAEAGARSVRWDGLDERGGVVESGVYFVRFEAAGRSVTRKISLLR
jgi:flagellar hook assembly protein FlgD